MKKIYLCAGHHNNDPGAIAASGQKERDLTKELKGLIAEELIKIGICPILDDDNLSLGAVIREIEKTVKPGDVLIDLHFDSSIKTTATGVGVFIKDNPSGFELKQGAIFSKKIAETLSLKDRGVKTETDSNRGRLGFLHGTGERFIFEICFVSNIGDLESYSRKKEILSSVLACEINAILN